MPNDTLMETDTLRTFQANFGPILDLFQHTFASVSMIFKCPEENSTCEYSGTF